MPTEVHSPLPNKERDKSTWRKSNLNASTSAEPSLGSEAVVTNGPVGAPRRLRRSRLHSNVDESGITSSVRFLLLN